MLSEMSVQPMSKQEFRKWLTVKLVALRFYFSEVFHVDSTIGFFFKTGSPQVLTKQRSDPREIRLILMPKPLLRCDARRLVPLVRVFSGNVRASQIEGIKSTYRRFARQLAVCAS